MKTSSIITRNSDFKAYICLGRPVRGFAQLHYLRKQRRFVLVCKVDSVSACIIIRLFIAYFQYHRTARVVLNIAQVPRPVLEYPSGNISLEFLDILFYYIYCLLKSANLRKLLLSPISDTDQRWSEASTLEP